MEALVKTHRDLSLVERTEEPLPYFEILPADWREEIEPHWKALKEYTRIFTLEGNGMVYGGGLLFNQVSPDTEAYRGEAQLWFDKGYWYIGFLFVPEEFRNLKLGSLWLARILGYFPQQKFWLTVEEENLIKFYEKNGFKLEKSIELPGIKEWLLIR